jgi:hypothetical protein
MPRVEVEPSIPTFERKKMVLVLERAATVIGKKYSSILNTITISEK